MTHHIQNITRDQIKEFLPDALQKALSSYHAFIDRDEFAKEGQFSKDHTACKVAISHIELLIKLEKMAYGGGESVVDSDLMQTAINDVKNFYNEEPSEDDDLA
jgi:hypothetical protein